MTDCTEIWKKYKDGVEHHNVTQMYDTVERCHRFYEGEQWYGLESGGEELPIVNFIKPICKYKIATVAMNDTAIIYSAQGQDPREQALCDTLTDFARAQWEKGKLDSKKWSIIKNACITGDHYMYCFDARMPNGGVVQELTPKIEMRLIDKTSLYLSNEQDPVLENQEWIIIAERVPVASVKKEAKANGISDSEIARIVSDDVDETQIGVTDADEVKTDDGKCTSILYMKKTGDGIAFCRSTETVIYQPEKLVAGLDVYPVCGMRWDEKQGSARGIGVVEGLIPNQIEVNRTVARRAICTKRYSFPTTVYDQDRVLEPDKLGTVGASVAVQNLAGNPISGMVQYLNPVPIGQDAANLQSELIAMSRELEGASDAATGQVDPTKASGEAIKAARDQSAMNLNEQSASYKQFVEDLATIWYKLWVAYSTDGMQVENTVISQQELQEMDIDIRIDISPIDPYSVLSREMSLENALSQNRITFDEYVDALDDNSGVPKDKFKAIIEKRKDLQSMNPTMNPMPAEMPVQNAAQEMTGGVESALPLMQNGNGY